MRAVSTVLDVSLCLLLVGAAVVALTVPAPVTPASTADETAELLASTTANVSDGGRPVDRRVHGTQAELLARAAVANLTLDGRRLAPTTGAFRRDVRERVRRTLGWVPERTAVTAHWAPYSGAPLRGRLAVGPDPPSGVSVGTATLTVPAPFPAGSPGSTGSYRALAGELSDRVIAVTLPGGGSSQASARAARRRDAYAAALDGVAGTGPADRQRKRIREALTARLAADMRARFDSPRAAAAALRTGRVTIVVREWSA